MQVRGHCPLVDDPLASGSFRQIPMAIDHPPQGFTAPTPRIAGVVLKTHQRLGRERAVHQNRAHQSLGASLGREREGREARNLADSSAEVVSKQLKPPANQQSDHPIADGSLEVKPKGTHGSGNFLFSLILAATEDEEVDVQVRLLTWFEAKSLDLESTPFQTLL
jgi:hypothetical protein